MAKTKKRLTNRGTIRERAEARREIGRLRDQRLRPTTLLRYCNCITLFINWLEQGGTLMPKQPEQWDAGIADYAEHLWETGLGIQFLGDLLSGLPHFMPRLRGCFKESWKIYGTWKTLELPVRAVPFSPKILLAMIGTALLDDDWPQAAAYLVGFMCMLRTGELVGLRWGDISFHKSPHRLVVSLGTTKGGQRRGIPNETVVTDDIATIHFLAALHRGKEKGDVMVGKSPQHFRKTFKEHLEKLHLNDTRYFPYSLRRGGATSLFRATNNLPWVTVQGRWASQATARIYINEGMTAVAEQSFPLKATKAIALHAGLALDILNST
jgi:hypothetical protein